MRLQYYTLARGVFLHVLDSIEEQTHGDPTHFACGARNHGQGISQNIQHFHFVETNKRNVLRDVDIFAV